MPETAQRTSPATWTRRLVHVLLATSLSVGVMAGAGAASARPAQDTITLAGCCPMDEVAVARGVVVLTSDTSTGRLVRIDPGTDRVVATTDLPGYPPDAENFDLDDLAVADGSVWVASYYANVVLRVDPVTLAVQDVVATGASPDGIVYAAGSLWTPLAHGRGVAQLDPATGTVVRTIPVGRQHDLSDSPSEMAWDGTALLVSLPGSGRVAHLDPATRRVTYDVTGPTATACARLVAVPDGYWLDDTNCSNSYYHWSAAAHAVTAAIDVSHSTYGAVYAHGALYTGGAFCTDAGCVRGVIVKHDPSTGAELAKRAAGTSAYLPSVALNSLWTGDFDNNAVVRTPLC